MLVFSQSVTSCPQITKPLSFATIFSHWMITSLEFALLQS